MIPREEAQQAANRLEPLTPGMRNWRRQLVQHGVESLTLRELMQLRTDLGKEILEANRQAENRETLNTYVVDRIMGLKFG